MFSRKLNLVLVTIMVRLPAGLSEQSMASKAGDKQQAVHSCASLKSCHKYKHDAPCQCNAKCSQHNNCCPDFAVACQSHQVPHSHSGWKDPSLNSPSDAPLLTFYMYRAQSDSNYPPFNSNTGSLGGVLWYLHNEIVPYCYTTPTGGQFGHRRYKKTRILRYKVTMKATAPLYRKGMNFGARMAFDAGKNTGAFGMTKGYESYGYVVGCNVLGHGPYPTCPSKQGDKEHFCPMMYGEHAAWYSLPGQCPSQGYSSKSSSCKKQEPGGYCGGTPTGTGSCTWTYENAGEVDLDWLVGIKPRFKNHYDFCKHGCLEYAKFDRHYRDKGKCGIKFWDNQRDGEANQQRIRRLDQAFKRKYPDLPSDKELPAPLCDFDKAKFYDGI